MDEFENLISQIQQRSPETNLVFAGPQQEESIAVLENAVGIIMPPSYRAFLENYGALLRSSFYIGGIYNNFPLAEGSGQVYYDTARARAELDIARPYLVIRYGDDPDEIVCLDSSQSDSTGEYPVVGYDSQYNDVWPIANNFNEYFRQYLQDSLDNAQRGAPSSE